MTLRCRCGWCGMLLREGDDPETTGMCLACETQFLAQIDREDRPMLGQPSEHPADCKHPKCQIPF